MSYVLVSLPGDAATQATDRFARWFEEKCPPTGSFHERAPHHPDVAKAVGATPKALVFGHDGGGSLRAEAKGPAWADPDQFAEMFSGARVWVYACGTRAKKLGDDLESFGRRAKAKGVGVFAGHAGPVPAVADLAALPDLRDATYRAFDRVFRAFLGGESSADELRRIGLGDVSSAGRSAVLTALPVQRALETLRILR